MLVMEKGGFDPFAKHSPVEITNDHNPERKAKYCMEAIDFYKHADRYNGILFDPYLFRQISEHYRF